jgi:hypothetical protein
MSLERQLKHSDDNTEVTVTTQVAALTYQNQVTASTAANFSQRQEQQYVQLALQQIIMYGNLHQIILQVNMLLFNASDTGCGRGGFGGRACTRGRSSLGGCESGPPMYAMGNFPAVGGSGAFPPGLPPG